MTIINILIGLLYFVFLPHHTLAEFNQQVRRRVSERLNDFLNIPVKSNLIFLNHLNNGGFPNDLTAPDRDSYNRLAWTLIESFDLELVSVAKEDGTYLINIPNKNLYREPGNSGYNATEGQIPPDKLKHITTCVNERGETTECLLKPGQPYIDCIKGCSLQPCSDAKSQRDCKALVDSQDKIECESEIKWCHQYETKEATEESYLGYIPLTSYCANDKGEMTQTDGEVRISVDESGKDCVFQDQETKVNRFIEGDYAYCGGNGNICNSTFIGGNKVVNMDARWRPWYKDCKLAQRSMWSDPYINKKDLLTIISYMTPIYSVEDDKNVFKGVLALDIGLNFISSFLRSAYNNTTISVTVFEEQDDNFMIGSSSGIKPSTKVFEEDETKICPDAQNDGCKNVRLKMENVLDVHDDNVLATAFMKQKQEGFNVEKLITITAAEHGSPGDSKAYLSQTEIFEQPDANLRWLLLIIMPMDTAKGNAIRIGDSLYVMIIFIGVVGFAICFTLFVLIYNRRKRRAIIYSDWKFTSAFIIGCATLNLSSLLLLGPNSNSFCLSRMLVFHWLFVATLAPLFAKTWRMYQLVGRRTLRRKAISNKKAIMYTMPFISIQTILLVIFALVDPPQQTEIIEPVLDGDFVQNIVCKQTNIAFMIVEVIFEGGLVFVGCFLAWKTRDLNKDFGEARQMIAAMYNIAFVALVIMLVSSFMKVEEASKYVLQAIGILWGTVFSSAAFVVPRLLQNHRENSTRKNLKISGESWAVSKGGKLSLKQNDSFASADSTGLSTSNSSSRTKLGSRDNVFEVNVEEKKTIISWAEEMKSKASLVEEEKSNASLVENVDIENRN